MSKVTKDYMREILVPSLIVGGIAFAAFDIDAGFLWKTR